MNNSKIIFNRELDDKILRLDTNKHNIFSSINNIFRDKTLYKIYESKYNIVVEQLENDITKRTLLRIIFDENSNVQALIATEIKKIKSIIVRNKEIRMDNLLEFILSSDKYKIKAFCPYFDNPIPKKLLQQGCSNKQCNQDEISCNECSRRSRKEISTIIKSDYGNIIIGYNMENNSNLIISYETVLKKINTKYGFIKDNRGDIIIDKYKLLNEDRIDSLIIDGIAY